MFDYTKKKDGKIFVFDRGVQKRTTFEEMSEQKVEFVARLNESVRKETVRIIEQGNGRRIGGLLLVSDQEIRLFRNSGKITTDETFR